MAAVIAPLPVAPRPYPEETLRSWADRVGAWYGLSGTDLVRELRIRAHLPEARGFSSLEDCEHDGITPGWITDLLADAAQLPRAHIHALRQDDYARWIPPHLLWNVLGAEQRRRCWPCVAAHGEDHERRMWRAGWTSVCLEHGIVLNTRDRSPSPYAVQRERARQEGIRQGAGWVRLPWLMEGQPLVLPLPLMLGTLATLAEYLCDEAEAILFGSVDASLIVSTRLIDIAAQAARVQVDRPVSGIARGPRGWRCRNGLTASQHHGLMAGLGWLLSAWPEQLVRLLFHPDSPPSPMKPWQRYVAQGDWNVATLRECAGNIAWPLWRRLSEPLGVRVEWFNRDAEKESGHESVKGLTHSG